MAALHAMQTGVAMEMQLDPTSVEPKHLRVGINAGFVGDAAMVRLLVSKGVFTMDEYYAALADEAEVEVARYESLLTQRLGKPVRLH